MRHNLASQTERPEIRRRLGRFLQRSLSSKRRRFAFQRGRGNDLPRHTFRKKFLSDSLYISSSSDDSEADETDDDTDDDDDDGDDHGDETWDKVSYSRNYSPKKRSRLKTESSSIENSCILGVTSSNLRLNRVVSTYNSTLLEFFVLSHVNVNIETFFFFFFSCLAMLSQKVLLKQMDCTRVGVRLT